MFEFYCKLLYINFGLKRVNGKLGINRLHYCTQAAEERRQWSPLQLKHFRICFRHPILTGTQTNLDHSQRRMVKVTCYLKNGYRPGKRRLNGNLETSEEFSAM